MHIAHRRETSHRKPTRWLAQAIASIPQIFARGLAAFGFRKKRDSTSDFIEQMNLALRRIPQEVLEELEELAERERPWESESDRELRLQMKTRREKNEAMREEHETLKQIRRSAGEDTATEVAAYQQYLREHPDNPFALTCLGTALLRAGRLDESLAVRRQVLHLKQESGQSCDVITRAAIAEVLKGMGRLDEAVAEYRMILDRSDPNELSKLLHGCVYLYLGDALKLQGKRREARQAWKQAVKQDRTGSLQAEVSKRLKE